MQKAFVLFILAAFLGTANSQMNASCNAADVQPVQGFDSSKILGKWYGIEMTRRLSEDVHPVTHRCLTHNISVCILPNCVLEVTESLQNLTGDEVMIFRSNIWPSEENKGVWIIQSRDTDDPEATAVHVHTDYENWNVQYVCQVRNGYRYEEMLIMTRSRTPSQEVIDILESIITGHGFPRENAVLLDQTNCSN